MKKTIKAVIAAMLVVGLSVCCFAGCSSKSEVTGKWNIVEMKMDGQAVDMTQITQIQAYMEFTEDGKAKYVIAGQVMEGTYAVDGNSITITIEDDAQVGKLDGNKIIIDQDGNGLTLEKE